MHEDFTLESLADYLHLSVEKVSRLVDRGDLPGRRVGGVWRFAAGEVHHWLEQRIGLADESELLRVESALGRSAARRGAPDVESITIAGLMQPELIALPLPARTRSGVISSMAELAMNAGLVWDAAQMAEALRAREDLHPTALDNGTAILHPRRPLPELIGDNFVALGITGSGIGFGGSRGVLTDVFFLIGALDDRCHLRILTRLSRLISQNDFLSSLRSAADRREALEIVAAADETVAES